MYRKILPFVMFAGVLVLPAVLCAQARPESRYGGTPNFELYGGYSFVFRTFNPTSTTTAVISVNGVRLMVGSIRFRRFAGARQDVGLDRTHLAGSKDFLERGHAERSARPAKNNFLEVLMHSFIRVPEIGQGTGHGIDAVATGALAVEKEPAVADHFGRGVHGDGRHRGRPDYGSIFSQGPAFYAPGCNTL